MSWEKLSSLWKFMPSSERAMFESLWDKLKISSDTMRRKLRRYMGTGVFYTDIVEVDCRIESAKPMVFDICNPDSQYMIYHEGAFLNYEGVTEITLHENIYRRFRKAEGYIVSSEGVSKIIKFENLKMFVSGKIGDGGFYITDGKTFDIDPDINGGEIDGVKFSIYGSVIEIDKVVDDFLYIRNIPLKGHEMFKQNSAMFKNSARDTVTAGYIKSSTDGVSDLRSIKISEGAINSAYGQPTAQANGIVIGVYESNRNEGVFFDGEAFDGFPRLLCDIKIVSSNGNVVEIEKESKILEHLVKSYEEIGTGKLPDIFIGDELYHVKSISGTTVEIYQFDGIGDPLYFDKEVSISGKASIHIPAPTPKFVLYKDVNGDTYAEFFDSNIDISVVPGGTVSIGQSLARMIKISPKTSMFGKPGAERFNKYQCDISTNEITYTISGAFPGEFFPTRIVRRGIFRL